ncbi:TrkH family potassium uptake protein [Erysipelothrix sp. HDW6A]|uniref:TrkH family potassium uptake protein n=1 Tax=Erysipelothrix sp. HDW6A TaxID=2714928 RepID=UPI001F110982|nr:TrkH family potassium uptake protein [Erysipelothrix sp. HDW6A]
MSKLKNKLKTWSILQLIVGGFSTVILTGTLLLMLPISTQTGEITPFLDALFTATSATCVTGQVTLNTAAHWSYFGKTVIITMIEIGGLGFMTVIVLLFFFIGKKLNIKQRKVVSESLNLDSISEASDLVKYVIRFAVVVQIGGALLLSIDFLPRFGLWKGIYFSLFHSISAFCNAGFDLFGDSLISFQSNPLVLLTISSLIIIGGLGFIVWRDLLTFKRNKKLLLHTRIVVIITSILLVGSFLLLFMSETKNGTFSSLSLGDRIINVWFMAVTPRTAGYANIDYMMVSKFGILLTIILMFIGGSSGSTAGGVKVTSIAVIAIYLVKAMRGEEPVYNHRTIPIERVKRSLMLVAMGITVVSVSALILTATETIPAGVGIEYILVEVFSCFGTVGLTMGLTPHLTAIGKLVLIFLMFVGRIGLITFFWSFKPTNKDQKIRYPEGNVLVG